MEVMMNKLLNKRTGIIAAVIAVVVIAAIVISTSFSSALTLDEAKEIAQKYVPSTAKFITSEEEDNKFEIMFHDDENAEGFEVEVYKDTKAVKKVESQLDNDLGSEKVELKEDDVKKIIEEKFEGVTSVSVTLNMDNGLYEYEADFKANDFYGNADVHPVSGVILDSTVKYGTAVTIPMNENSNTSSGNDLLTSSEVEDLIIKEAGGGFVKDMDLDRENGVYYYEVELVKDGIEYDYYVNAQTGEITLKYQHESYFNYDNNTGNQNSGSNNAGSGNNSGSGDASSNSGNSSNNSNSGSSANSGNSNNSGSNASSGNSSSSQGRISYEKAQNIVLAKIPGADIRELQLERDDGIYVYEGEAILGDYEYEFEINASSGVIIKWERDRLEWDD